jgi:hypothetical protein
MNCRICNRECQPLFQLDNMPANNQHLSDKPDSKGITLNVVQCRECNLMQLDNKPVTYWKESINSSFLSKELHIPKDSVSFMELEHQPKPNDYLKNIGNGSIQVPDCGNGKMTQYDYCIDHLMYFNEKSLQNALERNGFIVSGIESIFNNIILSAKVHKYHAVYGAGHQAFAWLAQNKEMANNIEFVIDDNVEKCGRYTPATNIPIRTPDALKELDAIIVMAGGYSDEVLKKLDDFKGSVAILRGNKLEVIR